MKKLLIFLLCSLTGLFFASCGGSEAGSDSCETNFDCPIGKICSAGHCVSESSSENGTEENDSEGSGSGDLPDDTNQEGGGSSDSDGSTSPSDDSDPTDTETDDITGACEPGQTQKCEYQGEPATENVGPCQAATRTCREDGTWGHCEGAVYPVYESGEDLCTNGIDDDCDGVVDNPTGTCAYWSDAEIADDSDDTDTGTTEPGVIDVGYTGDYGDAYQVPVDSEICNDTCVPLKADCFPTDINEGDAGLCNGLDDDCDGIVDEGCSCTAGQTQPCFMGPKNFRNVGTCRDGVQTCKVVLRGSSVGQWGECVGGISPAVDKCDNADNNCNGCNDDQLCCAPPIDCSYDIGTAAPFADKIIDGKQIYDKELQFNDADTATWEWTLSQGPCDIVLGKVNSYAKAAKTQGELGTFAESDRKTVVSGVGLSQFKVKFRLSGSYKLKLKVTRTNGDVHECEWIIKVVSDGLRIELCWDTTGSIDLDLHMGKNGTTTTWASNDCYYSNCKYTYSSGPDWGYANTDNYDKDGNWKNMRNPRLDIDNISTSGEPENINVDNPNNNDTFRVMVRHYSSK